MTRDGKSSLYWSGSALAALIALAVIMWATGAYDMGGTLATME
jgi:hypothetical protein